MYHYVRELRLTNFPDIKGLLKSQFINQLEYFDRHYQFVKIQDCINAIYDKKKLPSNAILLTFDDGYIDHFETVFPILKKRGIQGCFFPPAEPIIEQKVLDVNKIHFILASSMDPSKLIVDINKSLDEFRSEYLLNSNNFYYSKLAKPSRFDTEEVIFIKRLLQLELKEELRSLIVDQLFNKYVTKDEASFSNELYMNLEQIKILSENGMYVGSHGFSHRWLNNLSIKEQEIEIDRSLDFLNMVNVSNKNWVMCYPYGAHNKSLIDLLRKKKCKLALSTKPGLAKLSSKNAYTLERFDTNDFPKT